MMDNLPNPPVATRDRILAVAHDLILNQGYAATSLDQIAEQSGITKGAFFHHFRSKGELAESVVQRFADEDHRLLADGLARAEKLSDDPLQQLLILVGLIEEMFDGMTEPHPGCLFASYCYQNELHTDKILAVINGSLLAWRIALAGKLRLAAAAHRPQVEIDADALADMLTVVLEGGYVMAKTTRDPALMVKQLRQYRQYLKLLFAARPA